MATKRCDGVFEGGGVKGVGLVGAVAVTEEEGYEFCNVAGTSAGAIVAALVAAGFTAAELRTILTGLDFGRFRDRGWEDRIPLLGPALSLGLEKGIYEGAYFEQWLRELLATKGKRTFRDLVLPEFRDSARYRYRLRVVASDISRGKLLVLPQDIRDFGLEPDDLDIAHAVRMSMSIPLFYEPVRLPLPGGEQAYVVDGGVLSNFPVHLFDDGSDPPWPTFGYLLVEDPSTRPVVKHRITGPITLLAALVATMMEAHDRRYIDNAAFVRTITVPTGGVRTTDFDLSPERALGLYEAGRAAARTFFATWDFERYKREFRQTAAANRRDRLLASAGRRRAPRSPRRRRG